MRIQSVMLLSCLIVSIALAQQGKPPAETLSAANPAAASAKASSGTQEIVTQTNSLGLTVTQAITARGIDENKNPVEPGTEFAADGRRIYCITQIKGAKDPLNIEHRWHRDMTLVQTIELPIKSLNWRTQSYKIIPQSMAGNWKVDVVLMPAGEVLTTLEFVVK